MGPLEQRMQSAPDPGHRKIVDLQNDRGVTEASHELIVDQLGLSAVDVDQNARPCAERTPIQKCGLEKTEDLNLRGDSVQRCQLPDAIMRFGFEFVGQHLERGAEQRGADGIIPFGRTDIDEAGCTLFRNDPTKVVLDFQLVGAQNLGGKLGADDHRASPLHTLQDARRGNYAAPTRGGQSSEGFRLGFVKGPAVSSFPRHEEIDQSREWRKLPRAIVERLNYVFHFNIGRGFCFGLKPVSTKLQNMHINSMLMFDKFVAPHIKKDMLALEVAPGKFPSDYQSRLAAQPTWETLDIYPSENLTYPNVDPYSYPIEDNRYDFILAGNVMEHVPQVWRWLTELKRVCKPGGLIGILAPCSWPFHGEDGADCWRIYPDGMRALLDFAGLEEVT